MPGRQRVFELRTYYTNEGKLDDLHKRFRDHTCQLLKKHGAELIGFWTPQDDKDGKGSKLIYLRRLPQPGGGQEDLEGIQRRPRVEEGLRREPQERRARQESRVGLPRPDRLQRIEVTGSTCPRCSMASAIMAQRAMAARAMPSAQALSSGCRGRSSGLS